MDGRGGAHRERMVVDTIIELADTLASDYDVGDLLHMLVERCVAVLDVAAGGVLLEAADGHLRVAAATSGKITELEELEIEAGDGACLEAYQRARQVLCGDLREAQHRWPRAAPKAVDLGIIAVCTFPLRLRSDCIGSLCLYRESPGELRDDQLRLAQAFADVAAIGILQQRTLASGEQRAQQLQHALESRIIIEQAKGILAERHGITPNQAFRALRRHARHHQRKVRELAQQVVDGAAPDVPID